MSTYSHKHESKTKKSPNKNSSNQAAQLKDNREASEKQNLLQSNLNNSSKVLQQKEKAENISNAPIQRVENKTGLPDQLKSGIESLSGMDMSDTRVHYNSSAPAQLQAHAFAQGNNIHIAPGQEQHLPHEAWHVVQQKQGRVKATKQLKGKTAINDDAGLEKEADIMGAKAMQVDTSTQTNTIQQKSISSTSQPIQRYSLVRDDDGKVLNRSQNGHFLVGVGYPNHELYIQSADVLAGLNGRLADGLLRFIQVENKEFTFDNETSTYIKVLPSYKTQGDYKTNQDHLKGGIKKSLVSNLAKEENPNLDQAVFESNSNLVETKQTSFTSNTGNASKVFQFKMMLEFIRKSLSQLGYTDKDNETVKSLKKAFVYVYDKVNEYIEGDGPQRGDIRAALTSFKNEKLNVDSDNYLIQEIKTKVNQMIANANELPETSSMFLFKKGHLNHQFQQIEDDNILLPRGCDLVAGTTMGKGNDESATGNFAMRFEMKSNMNHEDHNHFATKLLADGTDFVTIEGFAELGFNIFDDTWEFFLHGNEATEKESFKKYTDSRYDFFDFARTFKTAYTLQDLEDKSNDVVRSSGDPKKLRWQVAKKLEKNNVDAAMLFFNQHLEKGGGTGNLKSRAKRDHETLMRLRNQLYAAATLSVNGIPNRLKGVKIAGFNQMKSTALTQISTVLIDDNKTRGDVVRKFKSEFSNLINDSILEHESHISNIVSQVELNSVHGSFHQKIDALITSFQNNTDGFLNSRSKDARKKQGKLEALKRKIVELENYRDTNVIALDGIN
ncbi:DUF4157 domain-containing protein [uncultured Tenacibaculum sp.]|uniref:eCIS core domain-containing protein n=1 Tax=uncultured Tenacibaculum sp. TaxID=174713 RepID=UPI00262B4058|nr:DUF4157 domain-containing protein [uncultured Tenacibaculum sp.]